MLLSNILRNRKPKLLLRLYTIPNSLNKRSQLILHLSDHLQKRNQRVEEADAGDEVVEAGVEAEVGLGR
jgi:hypothetical protein